MKNISRSIVKMRIPILILGILLLIPSALGIVHTRINYDILDYLPAQMDTVKGQNILLDDFGKGGFSLVMVQGMKDKDIVTLKDKMRKVDHVESVIWYDDIMDISVPKEMLPKKYYDAFNKGDTTLMAVFFDTDTSADATMQAIKDIRSLCNKQVYLSGISAVVTDLKDLAEQQEPIYVGLAVLLASIVLAIFMDSLVLPVLFLASIGMAIVWNLGSNYFLGEISYITKALASVLQLAVTMDYSIFLWHSFKENKDANPGNDEEAMADAITKTFTSVLGSSVTTIAGFLALCFMSFTLGKDLGIVMGKGVLLGVIGCITTLPAMILIFDKAIEKTMHKPLMPNMDKIAGFITNHFWIGIVLFLVIVAPSLYGYIKVPLYYDFTGVMPKQLDSTIANNKLENDFKIGSTHMVIADANLKPNKVKEMTDSIKALDGVKFTMALDSVVGTAIPQEVIPKSAEEIVKSGKYQLMLISSEYKPSTTRVNNQITEINSIIKKYDNTAMLIGEAPCTKDLIDVTDTDFKVVNIISIAAIFIIIALVLKSLSLPFILLVVIEFSIFINLGIPYYTGTTLPFIAPICLSTIQLGATVDYAILMTTRYKRERYEGQSKKSAITIALSTSIPSIVVSALGFFAATFGVAVYSNIDIISSLCELMARGALVSMFSVIVVLPAFYMITDKVICNTSIGFKEKRHKAKLAQGMN